jgi:hypothetical protein
MKKQGRTNECVNGPSTWRSHINNLNVARMFRLNPGAVKSYDSAKANKNFVDKTPLFNHRLHVCPVNGRKKDFEREDAEPASAVPEGIENP